MESIGSSTRIEGAKLSDREVEKLLAQLEVTSFRNRDEQEVAGYADTLRLVCDSWRDIEVTESAIKGLHKQLLRHSEKDIWHRGDYKKLDSPILYLSRYINDHRPEYYRSLHAVTKSQGWEGWIVFMLKAVEVAAKNTLAKIHKVTDLMASTRETMVSAVSRMYSAELLDFVFRPTLLSHPESGQGTQRHPADGFKLPKKPV